MMKNTKFLLIIVMISLCILFYWNSKSKSDASVARFVQNLKNTDLIISSGSQHQISQDQKVLASSYKSLEKLLAHINPDLSQPAVEKELDITMIIEKNPISNKDYICAFKSGDRFCYPREFEAEKMWKNIFWGQILPAGLDIKVDIWSVERFARIIDIPHPKSDQLKQLTDPNLDIKQLSEFSRHLTLLLEEYSNHPLSSSLWLEHISVIKELSHDYKNGKSFASEFEIKTRIPLSERIPRTPAAFFLSLLDHRDREVRKEAAITIGNAFENNDAAHKHYDSDRFRIDTAKHPLYVLLMKLLEQDSEDYELKAEYVFALAQLTRGNPNAANLMFSSIPVNLQPGNKKERFGNALEILYHLFQSAKDENLRFRGKLVKLMADLYTDMRNHEDRKHDLHEAFWWTGTIQADTRRWCEVVERTSEALTSGKLEGTREYVYGFLEDGSLLIESLNVLTSNDDIEPALCPTTSTKVVKQAREYLEREFK